MKSTFTIRFAEENDISQILTFIRELADYEELLHEVVADETVLHESLFVKKAAEVILAEADGKPVGFALFFHNFSTFLGRPGIYLEDLYVRPENRGKGYGGKILAFLADLAVQRNCGRLEWWVLDRNRPAVEFYESVGAEAMNDWTVFRLSGENLKRQAGKSLG